MLAYHTLWGKTMEILEKKLVEKLTVTDVLCNKCGESCRYELDTDMVNFNSAVITADFGYGSTKYDMEDFEVHLCEDCYADLEKTFKIKPAKTLKW
jgi:protein-arginine kinase activator protein McsA